ncbi:hypothetical protein D9615_009175 [Tricholomella constricta]|uniref:Golgi apparatus membrane protein TVP38 n=1 Tax=Tricholomella constricta TaxID=117010 RepID=A0A8H5LZX7_9AGAR|nr:hypothetical protein D9615_009175 [Tricholomella constricta]
MASTHSPQESRHRVDHHDLAEYPYSYPPTASQYGTNSTVTPPYNPKDAEARFNARTPSPTPSEERQLKTGVFDWKTLGNWRFWIRRDWLWYYVGLVIILVITALVSIYHKQIVEWLTPVTRWLHDLPFGWLVPIGVLFVISFPPLFGHEIVAILCGLVWGLWIGFGIVSAGTFLGEVGNFYAFKYCCRARGEKLERTKITYACLAKVVRDGGFKIALIARLSAIPGHFTTAVFSTCGMGIIVFSIAAILSMPKQFITVYLGVILEQSSTGVKDQKSAIITDVVLAITFIITVVAMWYIFRQMNKVKEEIIYQRRKARQAKIARTSVPTYSNVNFSSSTVAFDPYSSDFDSVPLKVQTPSVAQSWDSHSRSNTNGPDPEFLYAPQPKKGRLPSPNIMDGIAYGHDIEAHGYVRAREQSSTDDLGREMYARPMKHARAEDMYGVPFSSAETVYEAAGGGPHHASSINTTSLATPHHLGSPPAQQPRSAQQPNAATDSNAHTPTQAQLIPLTPPARGASDSSESMSTPHFHHKHKSHQ